MANTARNSTAPKKATGRKWKKHGLKSKEVSKEKINTRQLRNHIVSTEEPLKKGGFQTRQMVHTTKRTAKRIDQKIVKLTRSNKICNKPKEPESSKKSSLKTVPKTSFKSSPHKINSSHKTLGKAYVLFIGNLPCNVTKEQLEDHFRKTGGVKTIKIPKEKGTDCGRGFAYIEFKDRISHKIGLRLHHTHLSGRQINVEFTSIGGNCEVKKEWQQKKNQKLNRCKIAMNS